MSFQRSLFLFILLLSFNVLLQGQGYDPSPQAQTGRLRFGSYFDADIDRINLYNGNLSLDITLFSLPGRELSSGLRLTYNAQKWQWADLFGEPGGVYTGGWRVYDFAGQAPLYLTQFMGCEFGEDIWRHIADWMDGLGTKHRYIGEERLFSAVCGMSTPSINNKLLLRVSGGPYSELHTGNSPADAVIKFIDGRVIEFTSNPTVRTPNGNYITRNADGVLSPDTLEREILFQTNKSDPAAAYYKLYKIKDANGVLQEYQLNFEDGHQVWNPMIGAYETIDDWLLSIDLPDNRSYTFEYAHEQGFLTKVTLPSGGFITYTYPADQSSSGNDYVVTRNVSYDGASVQATWNYDRPAQPPNPPATARDVTVTTPEGNVIVHKFNALGQEFETQWKQSGNTVQTVTRTWAQNGTPNVITTILATPQGNMQRSTTLTLNGFWDVTRREERDWAAGAPGSLISQTDMTYTLVDNLYLRLDRVQVSGINPVNSQFEPQGKTEFFYDEGLVTPILGCTVPNKGAPAASRRNLTRIRQYTDAGSFRTETFEYDELGNVILHKDPLLHLTQISYADRFSNGSNHCSFAYPTTETNAENHVTTTKYEYETGLAVETKDARNLTATLTYDLFNRLKTITEPSTRVITYNYDDTIPKVSEEVVVDPGKARKAETYFDKFYRPVKTVQLDPAGNVTVDTEYDGDERVKRVSQPYRTGSPVWTTTAYDVLNRPTTITNPDATTRQFAYQGNSVKPRDEAGNERWLTYNALGQLTQVEEPNPTLSTPLVTNYSYYVFGPLRQVTQGTQTRTFTHNWLGFMSSESHPESGVTTYTPDGDGRLQSRTDSRNVTTTYSYDGIDRLKTTTYSDLTLLSRTYDQNGFTGFLTSVLDSAGTTTFTYKNNADLLAMEQRSFTGVIGSHATAYNYDLDGRLTSLTYPSGRVVNYSYQASGGTATDRVNTIVDSTVSATLLQNLLDNPAGQITSQTLGNSVIETRGFNTRHQLSGIGATFSSTTLMNLTYGYGTQNNGQIRSRIDSVQPEVLVQLDSPPSSRSDAQQ